MNRPLRPHDRRTRRPRPGRGGDPVRVVHGRRARPTARRRSNSITTPTSPRTCSTGASSATWTCSTAWRPSPTTSPTFRAREFSRYAAALEIHRRFAGLTARRIHPPREGARPRRCSSRACAPTAPSPVRTSAASTSALPGERAEYWVVDYVEPYAGNEAVFGLDIRTRDGARIAAERARDTGEATSHGTLSARAGEAAPSYGLVIYLPVYGPGPFLTRAERREALRGFVNVVLRVDDIFADIAERAAAARHPHAHPRRGQPSASAAARTRRRRRSSSRRSVPVGAEPLASIQSRKPRSTAASSSPVASGWCSSTTSRRLEPLAAALPAARPRRGPRDVDAALRDLLRGRAHAQRRGGARLRRPRASFARSSRSPSSSIEALPNPVFYKDAEGRYLGCNRAFEEYVGHAARVRDRQALHATSRRRRWPSRPTQSRHAPARRRPARPATRATALYAGGRGTERDVLVNKATFLDPNGEIAGLVGFARGHHRAQDPREGHAREHRAAARRDPGRAGRDRRARPRSRDLHVEPGRRAHVRLEGVRGARHRAPPSCRRTWSSEASHYRDARAEGRDAPGDRDAAHASRRPLDRRVALGRARSSAATARWSAPW